MLVTRRHNWGEDRVMFFDLHGRLRSMLTSWTSLAGRDVFAQTAGGRSWFRIDDLRKLSALLEQLQKARRKGPKNVKGTSPQM